MENTPGSGGPGAKPTMTLRYTLSRLSRPAARRAFGRTWLGVCLACALVSLFIFGVRHAFFVATIWLLCVYAPVRLAIELLHSVGPRLRAQLLRDLARREDRYTTREHITLMVEDLFGREVRMPRLAPPDLAPKVIEAAVQLCQRAFRGNGEALGVLRAASACATLLERWVGTIAAGEQAGESDGPSPAAPAAATGDGAAPPVLWDPRASIQEQWVTLRSVAGLGALTKTLAAVHENNAGRPTEEGGALRAVADAAMDYADQIGLRLDGPAWGDVPEIPRVVAVPRELTGRLAATWMAFCLTPQPAPRRLLAFVNAIPE